MSFCWRWNIWLLHRSLCLAFWQNLEGSWTTSRDTRQYVGSLLTTSCIWLRIIDHQAFRTSVRQQTPISSPRSNTSV